MRLALFLLAAAAMAPSTSAFPCSLAVREHPILASHAPVSTKSGITTVRIAISEILLPERFGRTQNPFQHIWLGLRGHKLVEGTETVSPELVEVVGQINVMCFYPSDAYRTLPDGRLVVWISGKFQSGNSLKLHLQQAGSPTDSIGSVWRLARWSLDDDGDAVALPSPAQQAINSP